MTRAIGAARTRFPDISPRAWEHPADRGALVALRAIPGFDQVLKAISGAIGERSVRLLYLATSIPGSIRSCTSWSASARPRWTCNRSPTCS
jgi:hypothetical protein